MSRVGLGRHNLIEENAGDPLDGLVNLFDIGMILAVAFLIAGLTFSLQAQSEKRQERKVGRSTVLPSPAKSPNAHGRGQPVGQVYRLADGRLVYVRKP